MAAHTTLAATAVAPIPAHALLVFLLQLVVLLCCARVLGRLAGRLGMPAVVGELLAGVLLGPSVLAKLAPTASNWLFPADPAQLHLLDAVGQIGVILLVGLAGMQLDLRGIRRRAASAAAVSTAGLIVPLALGVGIGFVIPVPLRPESTEPIVFASFMGIAICVSAIPVIAKTLIELNLAHRNVGQLILTAGMIDDAIGWMLLSIVSALATHGLRASTILGSIGILCGVIAFSAFVGRPLIRAIVRRTVAAGDPQRMSGVVVLLVIGSAAATQSLGLEAILGAFLCGALIGSATGDLSRVAPLNNVVMSVLAPIFFATAGLRMDLTALSNGWLLLSALGVLVVAIFGKFAGAFVGGRLSKLSTRESIALGAGMNARGVIEVIIAMVGLRLGVLGTEAYTVLILVAVATSLMAPPILRRAMARSEETPEEAARAKLKSIRDGSEQPSSLTSSWSPTLGRRV